MKTYEIILTDSEYLWNVAIQSNSIGEAVNTIESLIAHGHTVSGMIDGICSDNCDNLFEDSDLSEKAIKEAQKEVDKVHEADIKLIFGDVDVDDGDLYILSAREQVSGLFSSTEKIRNINCSKCDNWEEMPADMPRHKMQSFDWIENTDQEASYKCLCGNIVKSTTE